jgi:hypothetical protein
VYLCEDVYVNGDWWERERERKRENVKEDLTEREKSYEGKKKRKRWAGSSTCRRI